MIYIIMPKIPPTLRLWVVSLAAIFFIVAGTFLLVAYGQGYTFDINTRQLKSSGLVLIDSNPNGAKISFNNKTTDKETPYRYTNAPAGDIVIKLTKNDYRVWQSIETVINGSVTFANYAFLLPNILPQQNIILSQPLVAIYQSVDHQKTYGLSQSKLIIYTISDTSGTKEIYQPPTSVDPTKRVIELSNIQISNDGSRILFRQVLANGNFEVNVLQVSSGKVDNLTSEYGFVFNDLRFNPNDSNELFWLETSVLKKIRINEHSISSNLTDDIITYSAERDRILAVEQLVPTETSQKLVSYDLSGNDKKYITSLVPDSSGYALSSIRSRYNDYISVIHNSNGQLILIKNPYNQPVIVDYGERVKNILTSQNGRFVVINQNNAMRTLDLEFSQQYVFNTSLDNLTSWTWFDDYHLVLLQNNQLRFVDFDGQNNQLLTPIPDVAGFAINNSNKLVIPLNNEGNIFKLLLTKK